MARAGGFPYFRVGFEKDARPESPSEITALESHLAAGATTDLIVISHGWNNSESEAQALYDELLTNAAGLLGKFPALTGRQFAVLGVIWPSKTFAIEELAKLEKIEKLQKAGGAAGMTHGADLSALRRKLGELAAIFDDPDARSQLATLEGLLPKLEDSDAAGRDFAEIARSLIHAGSANGEDGSREFLDMEASRLFKQMAQPISYLATEAPATAGTAAGIGIGEGGAAGLLDFASGALSGAQNILNLTTYYHMKARAGHVGAEGLNPILRKIRSARPALRIHLVGHSFGGRLVTAAAAGPKPGEVLSATSMSLLQAAFSHYGFAADWDGKGAAGFFRRVIAEKAIAGPVVITCTSNDKAVGLAYPIASLLAGQIAQNFGDKDSKYGGIGRNGAQKSGASSVTMIHTSGSGTYTLTPGKLHNLDADRCIADHGDVRNSHVAYAVLAAIAAT